MSENCTQPTIRPEWEWLRYELDPQAPSGCNAAGIFYGVICDNCGERAGLHTGDPYNMLCVWIRNRSESPGTHFKPRMKGLK